MKLILLSIFTAALTAHHLSPDDISYPLPTLTTIWEAEHTYPTHPMPVPSVTYLDSDLSSLSSSDHDDGESTSTVVVTVTRFWEPLHTYSTHPMPVPSVTYPRSEDEGDHVTQTETLVITIHTTYVRTVYATMGWDGGETGVLEKPEGSSAMETEDCHGS